MVIATASVVDPRPKSLRRLGETYRVIASQKNNRST